MNPFTRKLDWHNPQDRHFLIWGILYLGATLLAAVLWGLHVAHQR